MYEKYKQALMIEEITKITENSGIVRNFGLVMI